MDLSISIVVPVYQVASPTTRITPAPDKTKATFVAPINAAIPDPVNKHLVQLCFYKECLPFCAQIIIGYIEENKKVFGVLDNNLVIGCINLI